MGESGRKWCILALMSVRVGVSVGCPTRDGIPRPMFIGQYHITIDDKGRISVPAKFRGSLASGAVVTRGLDASLFVMPIAAWEELAEKVAALPLGGKEARAFSRFLLSGAMDIALDAQGRFVVPDYLRSFAQLQKNVVVVGVQRRLELWDEARWQAYTRETEGSAETLAEGLAL